MPDGAPGIDVAHVLRPQWLTLWLAMTLGAFVTCNAQCNDADAASVNAARCVERGGRWVPRPAHCEEGEP